MAKIRNKTIGTNFRAIKLKDSLLLSSDIENLNIKGGENIFGQKNSIITSTLTEGLENDVSILSANTLEILTANEEGVTFGNDTAKLTLKGSSVEINGTNVSSFVTKGEVASVYKYIGSVETTDIMIANAKELDHLAVGYVWDVSSDGSNYALKEIPSDITQLTIEHFDKLGGTVDLSNYATTEALTTGLDSKVDTANFETYTSDVETQLATKANKSELTAYALSTEVSSKWELDTKFEEIVNSITDLNVGQLEDRVATIADDVTYISSEVSALSTSVQLTEKFGTIETKLENKIVFDGKPIESFQISSVTQEEYNTLTDEQRKDKLFIITDSYDKFDSTILSVSNDIGYLSGAIDDKVSTIDFNNEIEAIESSINEKASQDSVNTLTGRVEVVETNVEELTLTVNQNSDNIATLTANVSEKADAESVYTKTEIDGKVEVINGAIGDNTTQIDNLATRVETLENSTEVDDLTGRVESLETTRTNVGNIEALDLGEFDDNVTFGAIIEAITSIATHSNTIVSTTKGTQA